MPPLAAPPAVQQLPLGPNHQQLQNPLTVLLHLCEAVHDARRRCKDPGFQTEPFCDMCKQTQQQINITRCCSGAGGADEASWDQFFGAVGGAEAAPPSLLVEVVSEGLLVKSLRRSLVPRLATSPFGTGSSCSVPDSKSQS